MDINTLKSWFQKGFKPTQEQFWSLIDSFRQKDEPVPVSEVAGLPSMLAGKADQGHKHTLADITDYNEEKEVLNGLLAMEASELETLPRTDGMYYIVLADDTLYRCAYNEETEEYNLEQVSPSSRVIYSVKDSEGSMRIYLFSDNQGVFQDVTGEVVDKTIYVQSLDELLTRELQNGVYTIVHVSTGKDDNMYGDVYMLTVGDGGSLSSRVLECKSGWAQSVVIDDDWNYSWQWHRYSYEGHQHTTEEVAGLAETIANVTNGKMNADGSNYIAALALVSPSISSNWTIRNQAGSVVSTNSSNSISVENGAKVDYKGHFAYAAPSSAQKAPTECDGSFGSTLPEPGTNSESLEVKNLTASRTFNANLYAPKSGLEVSGGKVVKATGKDSTSASASVSFYHRRFWGTSAGETINVSNLSSELSNSRAKTITFDCSGGKFFYIAYPASLGKAAFNIGGLTVGIEPSRVKITNEYGLEVEYYVYRSADKQTGSAIKVIVS